jgi:uncharacterized protein (TIGR03382 family)
MTAAHDAMVALGMGHAWVDGPQRAHHWDSGWVGAAVQFLDQAAPAVVFLAGEDGGSDAGVDGSGASDAWLGDAGVGDAIANDGGVKDSGASGGKSDASGGDDSAGQSGCGCSAAGTNEGAVFAASSALICFAAIRRRRRRGVDP